MPNRVVAHSVKSKIIKTGFKTTDLIIFGRSQTLEVAIEKFQLPLVLVCGTERRIWRFVDK